jgi:aminoglycoside phosphotransferase
MNFVHLYLLNNMHQFDERRRPAFDKLSSFFVTPRFQASGHVLAFVLSPGSPTPIYVVKLPRVKGDNLRLEREVRNLRAVHSLKSCGFDSVPKIVAYEDFKGVRLLVQTALPGQPMKPAFVRKNGKVCLDLVTEWLLNLQRASSSRGSFDLSWYHRLIEKPLKFIEYTIPNLVKSHYLNHTEKVGKILGAMDIPLVFEHGDMSSPNILITPENHLGVVDWELAEIKGLPTVDLFFFLTYVAFSRHRATRLKDQLAAFHKAFFTAKAWTKPYVQDFVSELGLAKEAVRPLFVLCWMRYVANLIARLSVAASNTADFENNHGRWLENNRYFALWKHSIDFYDELGF